MPYKRQKPEEAMSKAWPRLAGSPVDKLANKENHLELSLLSTIKVCDVQFSVTVSPGAR